ncbi:MAG: signal peptidase I [Candidatus Cohnella colombiensis]|uniref:Signal peptidase I n=1 Tax=Candidatus Cohnella colombiensis TaxID=3121368 RepID=A0AA95F025_9BACL|nr:MAG: signal peptidase I [Cohnella sp.]
MKLLLTIICFSIILCGCSKASVISDPYTVEGVEYVALGNEDIAVDHGFDGMARSKLEFTNNKVVVNPSYYDHHEIKRGDIIYYDIPPEAIVDEFQQKEEIIRVIAIEGERISIKKGQIYVDGSRLNTFYGKLLAYGMDKKQYSKVDHPGCDPQCQKSVNDYFGTDMEEIIVPAGYIFVLGDNSLRSIGSLNFGPLSKSLVKGKVLGYLKEK